MSSTGINTECRMIRAISSHRDYRGSKMRFLIVSALLACAAARPSHLIAPTLALAKVGVVPAIAYPAAIPTLSPGDVQAALIDAQVKAQDLAIAAADKNRELAEKASEDLTDKSNAGTDWVKENTQEAFWSVQDKQWLALDALKTAEAQLDGAIAKDAPLLAKSAVAGTIIATPIAPLPIAPGVIAPVVATRDIAAPAEAVVLKDAKIEEKKEEKPETEEKKELVKSVAIEASKENLEAKPQLAPIGAPIAVQPYGYGILSPVALSPVALSPVLKYGAVPQIALTPIVKTGW